MSILENFISDLTLGQPIAFRGLEIVPVLAATDKHFRLLTLEEALYEGALEICETSPEGNVSELLISNRGGVDVLVLEGEELRGAKQNRIVNTSIIIPAGESVTIPVSCVERGRWRYVSNQFASGPSVMYPSLRRESHRAVTRNLRRFNIHSSDQGGIWADISDKQIRMCIASDTEAMSDLVDTSITPDVKDAMIDEIPHSEGQVGFLAYINGGFAGGDIFGSGLICGKQVNKLIRAYYIDTLDAGLKFPSIEPEEVLKEMTVAQPERFVAIGKGDELRFESRRVQGASIVVDEVISHVSVFPK